MLESLVATLLNRFLGMYVKNFDAKQLEVGMWNGEVKLRNLELRREALDQLHLPVNVVEGHLGQLTLTIPFSNLRGKPVKANIEDVFLLAAPKEDAEYDEEEERKRAQAVKMEKIENAELLKERNAEGLSQEEQKKNQSFTDSLITAIVDNLQISIKNIHIRYEDSIAAPGHPFALGLTLHEFSAVSTDENWRPSFLQSSSETTHKLATLGKLAFYWNTDAELYGTGTGTGTGPEAQKIDHNVLIKKFREAVEEGDNHQYMLKPVSGRAGIEMDKSGKTETPKLKARLLFNELGFILDEDQYRDALMMVDLFHYFLHHQEYKKHRPKDTKEENPRLWIKFAGQAILDKIHDRNRRWSWAYMKGRRDDRLRYIELFKKKRAQALTKSEQEDLPKLEEKLTYEDIRFWRSLARNQLRKENIGVKKPPPKQTWTQWAWGTGKKTGDEAHEEANTEMTEQQRKELYDAIDWDDKKTIADSIDLPRESVKFQIESSLRSGSFTLKRDPHGRANEILSLMFDNFQAKAIQRPDSMLAEISLGGLRVYDGTTEGSLYPQIVKVKDTKAVPKKQIGGKFDEEEDVSIKKDTESEKKAKEDSLFHMVFERNPLDESADSAINLKLKSVEVIYNPNYVVEIAKFFQPPERHMESIGALMETAGATVEGIRQQTRAGLEFALQEHKTLNAKLDIQAPLIIIPESITEESTMCLILDVGHLALNSELVDNKTMKEIQSKQKAQYSEADYKQLEGLMYDKFLLKLDSTQVLIGSGIEATKTHLDSKDDPNNLRIIDKINMDFVLETSIIPKATDLTKTRVSGHLPVLHASISDKKYKNLMKLIDIAIPKFETDESLDGGRTKAPTKGTSTQHTENIAGARRGTDIDGRPRSKSVQAQHKDLVFEDDTDEEKQNHSQKSDSGREDVNLHQRNFEFNFTVDRLQGSLYRAHSDRSRPDQLLVELVAEHFNLGFYLRPFDMVAEIYLKTLKVDDHIESDPSPEFKQIISSQDVNTKDEKSLLNLKFVKVNIDSPELESTYEGIATNLEVLISTLNLIVTRKTLLTLLDFVLTTFTGSEDSGKQAALRANEQKQANTQLSQGGRPTKPNDSSDKIRIKVELHSIALILNNDGIRLATLSLHTADVGIFLTSGSMRISARLGSLSLLDDINQGASEESSLRQLITIQGDELADFRYQTYDARLKSYPGYDSKVFLRSGSIKLNFLEEPFRKIIEFLVKFGKMQAIFNAARQAAANQANQIQDSATKMVFDILIKTPIIVFPRITATAKRPDLLTAYLGEIYANNRFATLKANGGVSVNKLTAGIRNIRLTSDFFYENDKSEELEMIDKVDLGFTIHYLEHQKGIQRPDLEVEGTMSPVNLRIVQTQLKFLLELSQSVPNAFSSDLNEAEEKALHELPQSTVEPAKPEAILGPKEDALAKKPVVQNPEINTDSEAWTKLELIFKAKTIGLELILGTEDQPVGNIDDANLSQFSINDTDIKLRMLSDGALESELLIHSFTVKDSRANESNKFRKVMSLINNDVKQQLMASVSISGGEERHLITIVTLDSPRVIFAMEYVFALVAFMNDAIAGTESLEEESAPENKDLQLEESESVPGTPIVSESSVQSTDAVTSKASTGMTMSFRINIEDAQVVLIANPSISNSEAIVLGTKQLLLSQQNASTIQITKVGMFLCRMDKFDSSRLRILDDFSIQVSMDNRSQSKQSSLTSIHIEIEPLVLRLSLRDILLALQIVNKASEMTSEQRNVDVEDSVPKKIKEVKSSSTTPTKRKSIAGKPTSTAGHSRKKSVAVTQASRDEGTSKPQKSSVMKREEMSTELQGVRVILIGDPYELPLIDWSVKKFNVDVRDWSGDMTADTSFDTYINVFNFSKSAWEPLIEPWQLGFHISKQHRPSHFAIELYSHKTMELSITSATIALASKSAQFLSTDQDVLSKPRGTDAPYRIRNYSGFSLNIWAATRDEDQGSTAKLGDGEECPWRFEDATTMRENLSPESDSGVVGVKFEGSGFESIERIPVNREGETLYNLKPRQEKVLHRLLVEVKLGSDNVKYVTFRSPLLVENKTQIPIEIGVFSPEEGHLLKIEKILPGEARPAPVGAAFKHSLVVRPDQGFGYAWSNERLFWQDLLKRSSRTITCKGESGDQSPPFHFRMNANYDKNDPMTKYLIINHSSCTYPNVFLVFTPTCVYTCRLLSSFKICFHSISNTASTTKTPRKTGQISSVKVE